MTKEDEAILKRIEDLWIKYIPAPKIGHDGKGE